MSLVMADVNTGPYRLHELVWRNDFRKLDEALKVNKDDIEQVDPRNRTPLMLAVLLGNLESARVLIRHGANILFESVDGFAVWQEAISVGDPELVHLTLEARQEQLATNHNLIASVLSRLRDAPDFYVEMRWEFSSWLPFVSRMCPSDTCRIWKSGTSVRIDTTLLGFENEKWERGNQSFLFLIDDKTNSALSVVVDHDQAEVFCERTRLPADVVRTLTRNDVESTGPAQPAAANAAEEPGASERTVVQGGAAATGDVALLDLGNASSVNAVPPAPADSDVGLLDVAAGTQHPAFITERYVAAKMKQPLISNFLDTESITFERSKSGLLGWRSDKSEVVCGFPCKVYSASNVQLVTVIRTEHLSKEDKAQFQQKMTGTGGGQANPLASFFGLAEKAAAVTGRDNKASSPARDDDPVTSNPLLGSSAEQELSFAEYIDSGRLAAAQKRRTSPTHEAPAPHGPYRDVGRTREESRKVQSFTLKAWLAEEHPLNLHAQLLPVIELMAHANGGHFDKLKTFITLQLPTGFPVKIEVPLYVVVNARITFANLFGLDSPVAGVRCIQTFEKLAGATAIESLSKSDQSYSGPLSINSGDLVERRRTTSQTQSSTGSESASAAGASSSGATDERDPAIAKFKTVVKCSIDADVFKIPAHYAGADSLDPRLLFGTPAPRTQTSRVAPRNRQQRMQFENEDAMLQYALQLSLNEYQRQGGTEAVPVEPVAVSGGEDDWELQRAIAESLRVSDDPSGSSGQAEVRSVPDNRESAANGSLAQRSRPNEAEMDEQTRLAIEISEQERLEEERRRKMEEDELERVLKLSEVEK